MAWLEKRNGKYHVAYREGGTIKRIPGYTTREQRGNSKHDLKRRWPKARKA